jgi:small subunit ribosomal protein S8
MAKTSLIMKQQRTPKYKVRSDKIPTILGGMGVAILSTSSGVMTDRQVKKQHLGGEVLAYVW